MSNRKIILFLLIIFLISYSWGDELHNVSNSPNLNSWRAHLAIDNNGILHAAWIEFDCSSQYYCYSKSEDNGEIWLNPMVITYTQWGNVQAITIDTDSLGNPHILFVNYGKIFYTKSDDMGLTWSTPADIFDIPHSGGHGCPRLIISDEDILNLVFINSELLYMTYSVCYSYSEDMGLTWQEPLKLSELSRRGESPAIALDLENNPHVVWEESTAEMQPYEIVYRYFDGNQWSQKIAVYSNDQLKSLPDIFLDKEENVHIVWREVWIPRGIFYSVFDGNEWSDPISISEEVGYMEQPVLCCDSSNNIIVVWQENRGGWDGEKFTEPFRVYFNFSDGNAWYGPTIIEEGPYSYLWGVKTSISSDLEDFPHIIWSKGDLTEYSREIYHMKFNPYPYIEVPIDIKPGSYPNSINLGSQGNVPVAIFSTDDFDATQVNPSSVTLAGASVKLKGKGTPMSSFEDINGDGLLDIVVHVDTTALELSEGDKEAVLEGETLDGEKIRGVDTVRIIY